MIKINRTHRSRTLMVGNNLMDEYRKTEKEIRLFGILIHRTESITNIDYNQGLLEPKSIGFVKSIPNEKNKED